MLPFVQAEVLSGAEMTLALAECEARGVRGGAIYDWLHLAAARKAGAVQFVRLQVRWQPCQRAQLLALLPT